MYSKESFESMTVVELRKIARENGVTLSAGISKQGIVDRLCDALVKEEPDAPVEKTEAPAMRRPAAIVVDDEDTPEDEEPAEEADDAEEEDETDDDGLIRVAIVGKPNVGKSSLLNQILGEERVIVSNIAGTTRDAIDSEFENETGKYIFIDTAGMRRKSKVDDMIERYSNMRTVAAIERADVCLILVDANEGVTEQDTKIAGLVHEAGKAAIIVVNKWDAVENKETNTMRDKEISVRQDLSYMTYAPVVFLSALTGQRVDKLFPMIRSVYEQNTSRITTGALNSVLAEATARVQPPTDKGRRLKIYYMTQAGTKPPHFVFFCNDAKLFHFSYQRYLENQIREVFGLQGTPIRITIRQKGDKEE